MALNDDASRAAVRAEAAAVRQRLRDAMQRRLDANLRPWQGRWLTPEELAASLRAEKRRAWVQAFELLLMLLAGTALSLVILAILRDLVY